MQWQQSTSADKGMPGKQMVAVIGSLIQVLVGGWASGWLLHTPSLSPTSDPDTSIITNAQIGFLQNSCISARSAQEGYVGNW